MHELAITEKIVRDIIEQCKKRGIKKIKSASLIIGDMTTYKEDAIRHYYDILKRQPPQDIMIEDSKILIEIKEGDSLIIKSIDV